MDEKPGFWRRWKARRESCAFIDRVVHREVFYWRAPDGTRWLGFSRWSDWMRVIANP